MSAEPLRELLQRYEGITSRLNEAIDTEVIKEHELTVAHAMVTKLKNDKDLIKEQIMCEKKLIDATR